MIFDLAKDSLYFVAFLPHFGVNFSCNFFCSEFRQASKRATPINFFVDAYVSSSICLRLAAKKDPTCVSIYI